MRGAERELRPRRFSAGRPSAGAADGSPADSTTVSPLSTSFTYALRMPAAMAPNLDAQSDQTRARSSDRCGPDRSGSSSPQRSCEETRASRRTQMQVMLKTTALLYRLRAPSLTRRPARVGNSQAGRQWRGLSIMVQGYNSLLASTSSCYLEAQAGTDMRCRSSHHLDLLSLCLADLHSMPRPACALACCHGKTIRCALFTKPLLLPHPLVSHQRSLA